MPVADPNTNIVVFFYKSIFIIFILLQAKCNTGSANKNTEISLGSQFDCIEIAATQFGLFAHNIYIDKRLNYKNFYDLFQFYNINKSVNTLQNENKSFIFLLLVRWLIAVLF